ncbi:hypothetical protein BKA70DRAFT_1280152 [Coprinopsis sp. MPI-PUGE-AT-0042]|nr:hypothetical protein BKA70DRAFT_1280152 [Coprinopsis sp. MPI-PUGE-AT-0042]
MSTTAQGPKDLETTEWSRSTTYYVQNVVIGVAGRLFSVPKDALASQSPVFEGMFDVGDRSGDEGGCDEKPIVLEGYKSEEFECLLKILLHRSLEPFPPTLSKQEWLSVLKLATIWQMDKVRTIAIDRLSPLDLSPIEKIRYAREYHVSAWFKEGILTIANNFGQYEMEELGNALGWKTTALILSIRDKAKPHLKISQWEEWTKCWECSCGLEFTTGMLDDSKQYLQCKSFCGGGAKYIRTKQPVVSVSEGPLLSEQITVEMSEDAVSATFAEEIKALDAYVVS